jgi:hydrogenase small subunit
MPGFPDKFAPFYKAPPGTMLSGTAARLVGSFVRPLRMITQRDRNREPRWDATGEVTSGWGASKGPTFIDRLVHSGYDALRRRGTYARRHDNGE